MQDLDAKQQQLTMISSCNFYNLFPGSVLGRIQLMHVLEQCLLEVKSNPTSHGICFERALQLLLPYYFKRISAVATLSHAVDVYVVEGLPES